MQRTILRLQGFSSARIRELERDRFAARLDAREALALEFARHVSRGDRRLAEDRERLSAAGWSHDAIRELAYLAAVNVYYNQIATLPAVPVARLEPITREGCGGPWSFLVAALSALPAGPGLRRVLDEACASPLLPRRSKFLVFAVVARTLGCPYSEREAIRLLIECGLAPEAIGDTLRHLHSPSLDPVEAAIVPFARETVRYRPAQIQRRARQLEPLLAREQLVELIGVAALANTVCRLGVVVGDPA